MASTRFARLLPRLLHCWETSRRTACVTLSRHLSLQSFRNCIGSMSSSLCSQTGCTNVLYHVPFSLENLLEDVDHVSFSKGDTQFVLPDTCIFSNQVNHQNRFSGITSLLAV